MSQMSRPEFSIYTATTLYCAALREVDRADALQSEIGALNLKLRGLTRERNTAEVAKLNLWKALGEVTGDPLWTPHDREPLPVADAEALDAFARIDETIAGLLAKLTA